MARSEVNYNYEADLAFRAPGSAAVTASAVIDASAATYGDATGLDLATIEKLVNVRPSSQSDKLAAEKYAVVIVVSALDTADTDETYTFNVYVGADGDGASGTKVGSIAVTATGQHVILLDTHTIENMDADREELALQAVLAGTTPSITFSAWLALG